MIKNITSEVIEDVITVLDAAGAEPDEYLPMLPEEAAERFVALLAELGDCTTKAEEGVKTHWWVLQREGHTAMAVYELNMGSKLEGGFLSIFEVTDMCVVCFQKEDADGRCGCTNSDAH